MVWEEETEKSEQWFVSPFEPGTNEDFFAQRNLAEKEGYYLVSPTMYGDSSDVRYAAIWARYSDTQPIRWFINVTDDEEQFKRWNSAVVTLRYRISYLVVTILSPDRRRYLSVFRDDNAGQDIYWATPPEVASGVWPRDWHLMGRDAWRNWIAYNVSEGQYEAFRDDIKKSRFYPICIQGSVIGPNNPPPQYAVIFGRRDRPYDRQWTVTGNGSSSLAGIDEVIKNFMQHDGIRAGVFVIADAEGKIKLLHGYTWAEQDIG
jgi:hypothetical protein